MRGHRTRLALAYVAIVPSACSVGMSDGFEGGQGGGSGEEAGDDGEIEGPGRDLAGVGTEPEPGDLLWSRQLGGSAGAGDVGYALALHPSGQLFIVGRWATADESSDAFLASLAGDDGAVTFERRWSGAAGVRDAAFAVTVGPEGRVFVGGDLIDDWPGGSSFVAGLDLGTGTEWLARSSWSEDLRIFDLVATEDGRVCASGHRYGDNFSGAISCHAVSGAAAGRLTVGPVSPNGHADLHETAPLEGGLEFLAFGDRGAATSGLAMGTFDARPSATTTFALVAGDPPSRVSDATVSEGEVLACGKVAGSMWLGRVVDGRWHLRAGESTSFVYAGYGVTACSVAVDARGHVIFAHGDVVSKYVGANLSWSRSMGEGVVISDIGVDALGDIYAVGLAPGQVADDPSDIWIGKLAP